MYLFRKQRWTYYPRAIKDLAKKTIPTPLMDSSSLCAVLTQRKSFCCRILKILFQFLCALRVLCGKYFGYCGALYLVQSLHVVNARNLSQPANHSLQVL